MNEDTTIPPLYQPGSISDPLNEIARKCAQADANQWRTA